MGLFIYVDCRRGPFDTLVIFTTTIRVISRYRAIKIVKVPLGWLYNFLVIRIISSLVVLYVVESLLSWFVHFLAVIDTIIIILADINNIFVDSENISFDASLVT